MSEFEAPENGVKHMRETIDRKDESIKKLEAELASYKDKEIDNVFGKLGLSTDKGFGKALKQVYDGPINEESISQFAKDEYGFEAKGQVQEEPQPEAAPVVQDDARSRVAALDANSTSDVPTDVLDQLSEIIAKGTPKDSIAAKLTLMENEKNSQ
tara:strand:+ start:507 stop:971 length:465 start_codon:yes stop_codon:yes gene_type:complete